jgi:hypothetical protein
MVHVVVGRTCVPKWYVLSCTMVLYFKSFLRECYICTHTRARDSWTRQQRGPRLVRHSDGSQARRTSQYPVRTTTRGTETVLREAVQRWCHMLARIVVEIRWSAPQTCLGAFYTPQSHGQFSLFSQEKPSFAVMVIAVWHSMACTVRGRHSARSSQCEVVTLGQPCSLLHPPRRRQRRRRHLYQSSSSLS